MDRVAEMHEKRRTFETVMASNPGGFELAAAGAFFGWVRHPYRNESSESVVRRLLTDCKVHALPGTAFMPNDEGFLRFSFANLTVFEIVELEERFGGMK
jgi:aspartate/methionine/tyrosine aminotransferase